MTVIEKFDWSECQLVEVMSRVQSGAPVLRGTRMPVNAIVANFDYCASVAETPEQFEVSPELHPGDCGLCREPSRCASFLIRTCLSACGGS